MVFRQKKGHAYKVRVSNRDRSKTVTLSTASREEDTAQQVEAFAQRLRDRKKWDALDALVGKTITLSDAYDADVEGTLDETIAELTSVDLEPLVAEWEEEGAKPRYVLHVRSLIPKGKPYPLSRFKRKAISKHLGGLPFTGSTRNRYRVALSQFSKWLIERDVIETNIVRDVAGKTENEARDVWYTWADSKTVIDRLEGEQQALEALMAGTGVEWQVTERLHRRDIDLEARTVRAKGHKNKYRNRVVRITEAWTIPYIARHIKHMMPNARVFTLSHDRALDEHHRVVKLLGLEDSTLHDWRHTYTENNYQAGMKIRAIKKQLGHAPNSTVLERHYQSREVDEADYKLRAAK